MSRRESNSNTTSRMNRNDSSGGTKNDTTTNANNSGSNNPSSSTKTNRGGRRMPNQNASSADNAGRSNSGSNPNQKNRQQQQPRRTNSNTDMSSSMSHIGGGGPPDNEHLRNLHHHHHYHHFVHHHHHPHGQHHHHHYPHHPSTASPHQHQHHLTYPHAMHHHHAHQHLAQQHLTQQQHQQQIPSSPVVLPGHPTAAHHHQHHQHHHHPAAVAMSGFPHVMHHHPHSHLHHHHHHPHHHHHSTRYGGDRTSSSGERTSATSNPISPSTSMPPSAAAGVAAVAGQTAPTPTYILMTANREGERQILDYKNRPVDINTCGNIAHFLNNISPNVQLRLPEAGDYGERYYNIAEMMVAFRAPFGVSIPLSEPGVRLSETKPPEKELFYTPQLSGFRFEYRVDKQTGRSVGEKYQQEKEKEKQQQQQQQQKENSNENTSAAASSTAGDSSNNSNTTNSNNKSPTTVNNVTEQQLLAEAIKKQKQRPSVIYDPNVLEWSEDAKPELRAPLTNQLEYLMKQPRFARLKTLRNTDLSVTSWFSVLWVPIHVKTHTPQNSAGAFLCFYLANPPAAMPGSGYTKTDTYCYTFRGDYLSTAPLTLWEAPLHLRGIDAFATNAPPKMKASGEEVTAAAEKKNKSQNEEKEEENNNAPSYEIDDRCRQMRIPIVGFIPSRSAADIWYRFYNYGHQNPVYCAPLFLVASAMQLMDHEKNRQLRQMLEQGTHIADANLSVTVLPDYEHLMRHERHLNDFLDHYTV